MVVLGMLALLAGMVLVNLPWFRSSGGPRALAEELAGKLEQMRGRARAGQTLTALAWLPDGQGVARSCLLLEGRQRALPLQLFDWSRQYPDLSGYAGGLQGLPSSPAPADLLEGANYKLSDWAGPYKTLPLLVFRPDGQAVGLNLPLVEGSYRLVVGDGLQTGAQLTAVHRGVQIQIPGSGVPRVEPLTLGSLEHPTLAPPATAPPGAPGAQPLELTDLILAPAQNLDALGTDHARLEPEAYLHLTVRARGSDFEPLTCQWTVTSPSPNASAYSNTQASQMLWNGSRYESTWEWQAPADSTVGAVYELDCKVLDQRGQEATALVNAHVKVRIIRHGSVLFSSDRDGAIDLYKVNEDGSRLRRLTWDADGEQRPKFSPDSSRIVFPKGHDLWLANADGSQARRLTNLGTTSQAAEPTWNALGTQIAYVEHTPSAERIVRIDADEDHPNPEVLLSYSSGLGFVDWAPDNTRLVFDINNAGATDLYEVLLGPPLSTPRMLRAVHTNNENHAHFSPDGTRLVYVHRNGAKREIWTSTFSVATPGGPASLTADTAEIHDTDWNSDPAWGPDGLRLVFGSRRPSDTAPDERIWQTSTGSSAPPRRLSIKNLHDWDPTWGR